MDNREDSSAQDNQLDENILNYIKRELRRGIPLESIRDTLLRVGHHPLKIDLHLRYLKKQIGKKPDLLAYLLIFFAVLLVISGAFNIFLYKKITLVQRYNGLVYESKDLCTKGKYGEAYKKLERSVKLDDKRAFAYAIYGHCYLLERKYEEAVSVLTEAVKKEANEPLYFYRLGVAYCMLNNYNFGIANLLKGISLNPSNPDFRLAIAFCYSKVGNADESIKNLMLINKSLKDLSYAYS